MWFHKKRPTNDIILMIRQTMGKYKYDKNLHMIFIDLKTV